METNADISVSSSAGDTAQNDRTTLMTINAELEVPSSDQGILYVCVFIEFCLPYMMYISCFGNINRDLY